MGKARTLSGGWGRERHARHQWLSLTPEPERELPAIVAALRGGGDVRAAGGGVERERVAVEEIVLRGGERDWLRYLSEAVALLLDSPDVGLSAEQRSAALEVLANHHRLLLGLPGDAAERTESERAALERALSGPGPQDDSAIAAEQDHPGPTANTNPNGGP